MRLQQEMKEVFFLTHQDLNNGPLERKASELPMSYVDPCLINNNKQVYLKGANIVYKHC